MTNLPATINLFNRDVPTTTVLQGIALLLLSIRVAGELAYHIGRYVGKC